MKKVKFVSGQDFDVTCLEVTAEDGPALRLLEFKGFSVRQVDGIQVSKCNAPRKTEYTHGNVDVLEGSMKEGWAVKLWPLAIFRSADGTEVLFDGRHTLRAMKNIGVYSAPVAIYERVVTGNPVLDSMSDETVLGLMGLFINATDGTTNAVNSDFTRMISAACADESIPLTNKNVRLLMDICGVNIRYNHKPTISGIYNAITNQTTSSVRVFNTTKEEVKNYITDNPFFGYNNTSQEDGVVFARRSSITSLTIATLATFFDGISSLRMVFALLFPARQVMRRKLKKNAKKSCLILKRFISTMLSITHLVCVRSSVL